VVAQLKGKEKDLQKQIADKKRSDAKLKNAIFAIIERERIKALEEEKKRLAAIAAENKKNAVTEANPKTTDVVTKVTTPAIVKTTRDKPVAAIKTYVPLNEKETELAADFKSNFGRLPWPVDNGVVCSNFGTNKMTEDNPGITICTPSAGVSVKSIFAGEVLGVFNLGDAMSVMIKHGNYYTIYSNLSSANVQKGATINRGQVIGKAGTDEDNSGGKIDFLLMLDKKNVNPRPWLNR